MGLLAPAAAAPAARAFAAAGATRYVDRNNPTASDGSATGCTSPTATPCRTIQGAINLSSNGDSIVVAPGTYPETLTITRSLAITGGVPTASAPGGPTVVDAAGLMDSVATISTTAGITLTALTLQHGAKEGGDGSGGRRRRRGRQRDPLGYRGAEQHRVRWRRR